MLTRFQKGLNMGGWISQYSSDESWENYLHEEDFKRVAAWGFDHVRVPFDYPCVYEHGMKYLDRADEWTKNNGLAVILDLHRAEGYFFGSLNSDVLFGSEKLRAAFVRLWVSIAEHFKGQREDDMIFELLNEMVEPTPDRWNALIVETIKAIRAVDSERMIMIGGRDYNSVDRLCELPDYSCDPKVIYTFHFYSPFPFTHQRAGWCEAAKAMDQHIAYPTKTSRPYLDYCAYAKDDPAPFGYGSEVGIDWLEKAMQPAKSFREKHKNNEVYLGEFGAIEKADLQSRVNYVRDVGILCKKHGYGRAMWAYTMGFGVVAEGDRHVISEDLIQAAAE